MNDYDFIKGFKNIKIASICKKLNIDKSNVYRGVTTKENLNRIRKEIEAEIAKLYKEN